MVRTLSHGDPESVLTSVLEEEAPLASPGNSLSAGELYLELTGL